MNDNKRHELIDEFYHWQKKCDGKNRYPVFIHKVDMKQVDQQLRAFIWFYKFEISCHGGYEALMKKKIKVIK